MRWSVARPSVSAARRITFIATLATSLVVPTTGAAQSGGFIAALGTDTLHVERFTRYPDRIEGTIVTRAPVTRIARWTMRLDGNGRPTRYELRTTRGDGTPERAIATNGWITLSGDTLMRETPGETKPDTQRIVAPAAIHPGPMLPYLGTSYLMYEFAFAEARGRATPAGESTVRFITLLPRQTATGATRTWFIGADSVELDYFGQARSGYRFDGDGRLQRADWTGTTYRYRITRVADVDVEAFARRWTAADASGASVGALSPRDTSRGEANGIGVQVEYSRPSKRGRLVWGDVVPFGRVWRLGADVATHMTVSADARFGEAEIPAGSYTLWLLPAEDGSAQLIVNKRTRIFGTQYDASQDLVRIPMRAEPRHAAVERLTIETRDGRFWIRWDDRSYSVPVVPR